MKRKTSLMENSSSGFKILLTQQKQQKSPLLYSFKNDLKNINIVKSNDDINFLTTPAKIQRKVSPVKSTDKKRMKLIDYIYIKNTSKKNQISMKSQKTQMSVTQLRKSRMKEGKQKAYKAILEEMMEEFKEVSAKASAISQLVEQNFTYTGSTEDIVKLCNIRRILKDTILGSITEIQKVMGIDNNRIESMSRKKISQEDDQQLENKLRRLQQLGVQRLDEEPESPRWERPLTQRNLKLTNKLSNRDTQITDKDSYREYF